MSRNAGHANTLPLVSPGARLHRAMPRRPCLDAPDTLQHVRVRGIARLVPLAEQRALSVYAWALLSPSHPPRGSHGDTASPALSAGMHNLHLHRAFGVRTTWTYIANIYHCCAGLPLT